MSEKTQEQMQEEQEREQEQQQSEHTFTQEEVNKLIGNAKASERKKFADFEHFRQSHEKLAGVQGELDALKQANSLNEYKTSVSSELGVPAELLVGDSEESIKAYGEKLAPYFKKQVAPIVNSDGTAPKTVPQTKSELFAQTISDYI